MVVPFRGEEDDKRHLKLMGDLGQVVPLRFDLRDEESIRECLRHSDVVYNLIGRDFSTKNFTYEQVHVEGARKIAQIAAEEGVSRLVHVSALNASLDSKSEFLRTKRRGEEVVLEKYPDATIVRPGTIYGAEDRFLNRIAKGLKYHFLVNNEKQRVRPVSVSDVAMGLSVLIQQEESAGKIFELFGPREYTVLEIEDFVCELILKKPSRLNLPKPAAMIISKALALLPWPTISPDEIERLYINDTPTESALTFNDLRIQPATLEDMALQFVRGYRSAMYYELATETAQTFREPKSKGKEYHTRY